MHPLPTAADIRTFRTTVYSWYTKNGRHHLPWRTDYNPYHILVSEIMLQQTQVDRVIDKFTAFIDAFPSPQALAAAPLDAVLAKWQGLGYNRRAVALRETARIISELHSGCVPDDPEILCTFPGIGPATAASIVAFAFDKPTIFLETNIRTVIIHHFFDSVPTVTDDDILPVATLAVDKSNPRKWYSAVMDYGTMLKKEVGNLSRRSTTYKKQSPFNGSVRQLRGGALRILVAKQPATSADIATALGCDCSIMETVLTKLVEEGLLTHARGRYRIAR